MTMDSHAIPAPSAAPPTRRTASRFLLLLPLAGFLLLVFVTLAIVPRFAVVARDFEVQLPSLAIWIIDSPYQLLSIGAALIAFALASTFATRSTRWRLAVTASASLLLLGLIGLALMAMLSITSAMSASPAGTGASNTSAPAATRTSPGP
jgi:hypothetical protein